jgi:ribosomal protein S18 acetylase RimI-like enzyme
VDLNPFPADRAATVAGWARTATEAGYWCGHTGVPVPVEKVRSWADEEGVRPYGLFDAGQLVAYGELWVDDTEEEVELARLIVDPRHRGRGVGRGLVTALVELARAEYPTVFLRVRPENVAALRCYVAAGFTRVAPELEAEWNAPQPVPYVWLTHTP